MPGSQALAAGSDATASQCNTLQYAVMETYNSSSCVQLPAGSTFDEEESEGGARREFSGARGREIADDSGEQMLHRSIAQSHGDGRGEYIRQEVAELRDHIIQLGGEGWGEREGGRGRADGDDESDNVEARELRRQIAHLVVARSLQKHQADELREQVGEKEGEREEERERKRKKERKKESQRGERRKKRQRERKRGKNKKQKERARENSRANARAIARAIAKKSPDNSWSGKFLFSKCDIVNLRDSVCVCMCVYDCMCVCECVQLEEMLDRGSNDESPRSSAFSSPDIREESSGRAGDEEHQPNCVEARQGRQKESYPRREGIAFSRRRSNDLHQSYNYTGLGESCITHDLLKEEDLSLAISQKECKFDVQGHAGSERESQRQIEGDLESAEVKELSELVRVLEGICIFVRLRFFHVSFGCAWCEQ